MFSSSQPPQSQSQQQKTSEPTPQEPAATITTPTTSTQQKASILENIQAVTSQPCIIPNELIDYYMLKTGIPPGSVDAELKKYIAVMSERYMSEIVQDAADFARLRQAPTSGQGTTTGSGSSTAPTTAGGGLKLTIDDLAAALDERGISIRRPPYHL